MTIFVCSHVALCLQCRRNIGIYYILSKLLKLPVQLANTLFQKIGTLIKNAEIVLKSKVVVMFP